MAAQSIIKHRHDYTVAWIAPLPIERASALVMLDEEHGKPEDFEQPESDPNSYTWGSFGEHNVIIASLASGDYGVTMAAVTVVELLSSFPLIKFGLLVGIGAGIPRIDYDIRLGDIVVGLPSGTSGGVIQYDLGKAKSDGVWERKDVLNRPPEILLKALSNLQARHEVIAPKMARFIQDAGQRYPEWAESYAPPDRQSDRLFEIACKHIEGIQGCSNCAIEHEISRPGRDSDKPVIHYGVIASGNSLVKDAEIREKISQFDSRCVCLEMEAAGIINSLPCIVIRGICDYADSHKNDKWQRYAAASAAAFSKELLECVPKLGSLQTRQSPWPIGQRFNLFKKDNKELQEEEEEARNHEFRRKEMAKRIVRLLPRLYTTPYADRKNRNIKRVPNTCQWFTNHNQFQTWYEVGSPNLFWVSADPGCGKSVLARYLIDEVLPAPNRVVCYFFFKEDSIGEQRSSTALCALLHQLLKQKPKLHQHPAIENLLTHGDQYVDNFWDLWKTFVTIVTDTDAVGEVVCVLDALDECIEADREDLMQAINDADFATDQNGRFKLLLTSRPYEYMKRGLHELKSKMLVLHLSGEGEEQTEQIRQEIRLVIEYRVEQIGSEKRLSTQEIESLKGQLISVENQTYLWVHIIIDSIRKSASLDRSTVERIVAEIPRSLDAAYEQILRRCPDKMKARRILGAILAAQQPLHITQVAMIMAYQENHRTYDDMRANMESAERVTDTIRNLCGLFIVIKDFKVYLLHQTARDFLLSKPAGPQEGQSANSTAAADATSDNWRWSFVLTECHKLLATIYVRFLHLTGTLEQDEGDFRKQALRNWTIHMKEATLTTSDRLIKPALALCNAGVAEEWIEARRKPAPVDKIRVYSPKLPPLDVPFSKLIVCVQSGVIVLLRSLLKDGINVNSVDKAGRSALSWATIQGDDDIVKLLLKNGAQTDPRQMRRRWKPLHDAVASGNSTTVKLLLDGGAKVNSKGRKALRAIHIAALFGYEKIVLILVAGGADLCSRDNARINTLMYAASAGHKGLVKLISDYEINMHRKRKVQNEALLSAASNGRNDVVRLLLAQGAEVNGGLGSRNTSLAVVARNGHVTTIRLLIEQGAEINKLARYDRTALMEAAGEGHNDAIQLLLEHGASVNFRNKDGWTALSEAVFLQGNEQTVAILLEHGADVKIHYHGETCLHLAACRKEPSEAIMRLLMQAGINFRAIDHYGRTPALLACLSGHDRLVHLFLEEGLTVDEVIVSAPMPLRERGYGRKEISSYIYDKWFTLIYPPIWRNWTLLHAAAHIAKESLVRDLLSRGANVDTVDLHHQTPLTLAAIGICRTSRTALAWMELSDMTSHRFQELYPFSYPMAQLRTVALLLTSGGSHVTRRVHWYYRIMPHLRPYRKGRREMLEMLSVLIDEAIEMANEILDEPTNLMAVNTRSQADGGDEVIQTTDYLHGRTLPADRPVNRCYLIIILPIIAMFIILSVVIIRKLFGSR